MTKSMKRTLAALLMSGLLAGPVSAQTNAARIATIDLQKVSEKYYKWSRAKQVLASEKADLEKALDEQGKIITREQDEYKKLRQQVDDPMITPDAKKSREAAAQDKAAAIQADEQSYRDLANQGQQKLDRDYQNLTDAVLRDIQDAVKAKAKAAGFTLVLNTTSDTLLANATVVFSNGDNDITDEIVKQLNSAAPDTMSSSDTNKPAGNPKK